VARFSSHSRRGGVDDRVDLARIANRARQPLAHVGHEADGDGSGSRWQRRALRRCHFSGGRCDDGSGLVRPVGPLSRLQLVVAELALGFVEVDELADDPRE